jgi:hypothetical protein
MGTSRRDCLKQMLLGGASLAVAPYIEGQTAETGAKPECPVDPFAATHEQRIVW